MFHLCKQSMSGCKRLTWVANGNSWALANYIYTATHVRRSIRESRSVTETQIPRVTASECLERAGAVVSVVKRPRNRSAKWDLENGMTWLRRIGQYSSPPSVCLSVCLTHTLTEVSTLSKNKNVRVIVL